MKKTYFTPATHKVELRQSLCLTVSGTAANSQSEVLSRESVNMWDDDED